MLDDDQVCYCFHVSRRKVESFCRNQKPTYASQISECLSAGTGCGWCVPLLEQIHTEICGNPRPWWRDKKPTEGSTSADTYASAEDYAAARKAYIENKKD